MSTPWPSWLIAAHPSPTRAPVEEVRTFLEGLTKYVITFDSSDNREDANVKFITKNFGYPAGDVKVRLAVLFIVEST